MTVINNGNWTEWSAIWSEIIRVISKSNERAARVRRTRNHKYDFRSKLHDPKFNYHFITSILKSHNFMALNFRCWCIKVLLWRKSHLSYLSHFETHASRLHEQKNAVYRFQISLFVPEIFKSSCLRALRISRQRLFWHIAHILPQDTLWWTVFKNHDFKFQRFFIFEKKSKVQKCG